MTAVRWVGLNGNVRELLAMRCVWCTPHHWLTDADRIRHEAGAPTSEGMCKAAADRMHADIEAGTKPAA